MAGGAQQRTSATATLAAFAAELRWDDLPDAVVAHAKRSILDTIGCGLFGAALPWSRALRETVAGEGGRPTVSVWGSRLRTSASQAALLNGTAAHGFELDDLHMASMTHLGAVALPAALAVCEHDGASGRRLLTAFVAGCEIGARVGMAVGTPHFRAGFHPQGTIGAFAAGAAAATAAGLKPETARDALGVAGTQAAGLMCAQEGAMAKRLHSGRAAQSGVYAALLARAGFTGAHDVLEADFGGFCSTMGGGSPRPELLTAKLGERWETLAIGFKRHASCAATHTSLDVVADLRARHRLDAADVASVLLRTSTHSHVHCGWDYEPAGVTAAQMSLQYGVARMLLDGEVSVDQFGEEAIRDPRALHLAERVEVVPDERVDALGPDRRHAVTVEIRLADGTTLSGDAEQRRGSVDHPLDDDELRSKFDRLAYGHRGPEGAAEIAQAVAELDSAPHVRDLAALLTSPTSA